MRPGSLDLSDPDSFTDGFPHDYFRMLRREEPVSWNEVRRRDAQRIRKGFFSVTRYDDVVHVSRHPELFSSALGGAMLADMDEASLELVRSMIITMDPPDHGRIRRLVHHGFTPRMVQRLEPRVRRYARDAVDRVIDSGEAEVVADFALGLPLVLLCELMGIPTQDRDQISRWVDQMVGFDDPDFSGDIDASGKVAAQMWTYAQELAREKRRRPDDSLISLLVHGGDSDDRVSEMEIGTFFVMVTAAGTETTRTITTQGLRLLCEHPDQLAVLRSDLDRYLPTAIEEVLRYSSAVMHFRRTVTAATELRGVPLHRGDKVVMWYPSANRDEDVWEEPDRFDVTRVANPHLAFGVGEHYCLGANLARMELACLWGELLSRVQEIRLLAPPRRLRSVLLDGICEMRIALTPCRAPRRVNVPPRSRRASGSGAG